MDPNDIPGAIPPQPNNDSTQAPLITPTSNPIITPTEQQTASQAPISGSFVGGTPGVVPPTTNETPQGGVFVGGSSGTVSTSSPNPFGSKKIKKSKKLPMLIVSALILLLGSGGYVFAIYIPNKPENVWSTGINRSGDTLDKIITSATEQDKITKLENSQLTTSIAGSADDIGKINGDLDIKFSSKSQDGKINFAVKGKDQDMNIAIKYLLNIPDGSKFPDIFVNVSGFKSLGLDQFMPGINDYDGKWISISSKYLESQISSVLPTESNSKDNPTITAQDISEISKVATKVSSEYVFSTDPAKAILVNKEYLGKESVEGVSSFHYKVGINPDNAVKFCKQIVDQMLTNDSFKKVLGNPDAKKIDEIKKSATKDCDNLKNDIKPNETFEAWIDAKYKLINKVRVFDNNDTKTYIDIGQRFTGGDEIPYYIDFSKSSKTITEGRFTLTANLKTFETKGDLKVKTNKDGGNADITATMTLKPITEEIKITAPTDAILIEDVLKKFQTNQNDAFTSPVLGANTDSTVIDIYNHLFRP